MLDCNNLDRGYASTRKGADFQLVLHEDQLEEPSKKAKQMTEAIINADGAVFHDLNWPKAKIIVRRLQVRIIKAVEAGRWGKVRILQRLLTHSFSAKIINVQRFTEDKDNIKQHLREVRTTIKNLRTATQEKLIKILMIKIKNWCHDHRNLINQTKVLRRLDMEMWRALWQWSKRRHSKKSRIWIKAKYFHTIATAKGKRNWVFAVKQTNGNLLQLVNYINNYNYFIKHRVDIDSRLRSKPQVMQGLSRMLGNKHVRFLGEGALVTSAFLPDSSSSVSF